MRGTQKRADMPVLAITLAERFVTMRQRSCFIETLIIDSNSATIVFASVAGHGPIIIGQQHVLRPLSGVRGI